MKRFVPLFVIGLAVVIGSSVILLPLFIKPSSASLTTPRTALLPSPLGLPGLLTGPAPWPSNTDQVEARFRASGIPTWQRLPIPAMHTHQHLDIYIHGQHIAVPGLIGISMAHGLAGSIHTEDNSGIIHVESPIVQHYYLGQFFDVWGVRFDESCIGGYCISDSNILSVYVNGRRYTGDPRSLLLSDHAEIVITFGSAGETPSPIPVSYQFPYDPS